MRILTFDIEDWFHILDNQSTKSVKEWEQYPSRLAANMDKILNLLDKYDQKATFFCLGWIAEKYPEEIKKIFNRGHEIGSHSHYHQLVYEQSPEDFREDLLKSKDIIEQLIGEQIRSYRAPGFSITSSNNWAFEILVENGFEVDCSIFPANRSHGGFADFGSATPCKISINNKSLKEFPINSYSFFGTNMIYSGGGYFRLFPYPWLHRRLAKDDYVMTYFHPRDFDPDQPMIEGLSIFRKFKSYVGLSRAFGKLEKMLRDFDFMSLDQAEQIVDWKQVRTIDLKI